MKCPTCAKGVLRRGRVEERMFGVHLGSFPAAICSKCGESFTDEKTTRAIQAAAKQRGLWGLGRQTTITKAGNSLAVRIPKNIATFLKLKNGTEAYIHPESGKLIVEASALRPE